MCFNDGGVMWLVAASAVTDVVLRTATPADGTALAAMRWQFRAEDAAVDGPVDEPESVFTGRFLEFFAGALARGWTVWVAERADRLVAHIWVYAVAKVPRPGSSVTHFGYMTNVYAVPEARDAGVGGALLERVVQWATDQNFEMLLVWPSDRSVPYYARAGFVPDDEVLQRPTAS